MKNTNILGIIFCSIIVIICSCISIYGFYEGYWQCGITFSIWTITFCLHTYAFKCWYEIDKREGR